MFPASVKLTHLLGKDDYDAVRDPGVPLESRMKTLFIKCFWIKSHA